jgi:hypothetical protein
MVDTHLQPAPTCTRSSSSSTAEDQVVLFDANCAADQASQPYPQVRRVCMAETEHTRHQTVDNMI